MLQSFQDSNFKVHVFYQNYPQIFTIQCKEFPFYGVPLTYVDSAYFLIWPSQLVEQNSKMCRICISQHDAIESKLGRQVVKNLIVTVFYFLKICPIFVNLLILLHGKKYLIDLVPFFPFILFNVSVTSENKFSNSRI